MRAYASSVALALASTVTWISPAAADVTAVFSSQGPIPSACVEYSYLTTGKRLDLELSHGAQTVSRMDKLQEGHFQVQVYTMQSGGIGSSWMTFPAQAPKSELIAVVFLIRGRDAVITVVYADGSSVSDTKQLSSTTTVCPSPK